MEKEDSKKEFPPKIEASNGNPNLSPEDRPENEQPLTNAIDTTEAEINALLTDIRKKASAHLENISRTVARAKKPNTPPETVGTKSKRGQNPQQTENRTEERSDETPEQMRQLLIEVNGTVHKLQTEVKQLRKQLEKKNLELSEAPHKEHHTEEIPKRMRTSSPRGKPPAQKKNKAVSMISNMLFYAVIVAILFGALLIRSSNTGRPAMFAGYSAFTVLTSSMENVYPKGSLVVTKTVDAKELKIGDDITFMINEKTSVTHRIVAIDENYQGSGTRAFTTKGTTNQNKDKDPVAAANIVGKVIYHSKILGNIARFARDNWPYLLFVIIVLIVLCIVLKRTFKDDSSERKENKTPKKSQTPQKHTTETLPSNKTKKNNKERK